MSSFLFLYSYCSVGYSDRWQKLYKDFYSSATNMFDLTKVPDVYGKKYRLTVII